MIATVKWLDGMRFVGTSESGHAMVMDGDNPGTGPSPMEMILMAVGGCSSVDVVSILQKARQDVQSCEVEIKGTRADDIPRVFTEIELVFVITGREVQAKHVERAVNLSMEKYCSVSKMLEKATPVRHSFRIVDLP
ncbi:OsmC family protein [Gallaecimonas kandeliae]|uniref:OsmC family protein n=1 Tax=Gallaecimonas kandeliae TaxID=3029055 RepID=UPI00264826B3|nr:OsmC family protein [Gallaecimonas kandeliae]WKE65234.1 OsmC family protein [Gallaecimonas kandeliae]